MEILPGRGDTGIARTGDFRKDWIFDAVMERYRWSEEEHQQTFCNDGYYYYRHYKNYVDRRISPDDYRSNIGVGVAFPVVEIVHARLQEPWLSGDWLMNAIAEEMPGRDLEDRIQAFVNNVLMNRVTHSYGKHSMMAKAALILGRGVMKPHIRYVRPQSFLRRVAAAIMGVRLGSEVVRQEEPATRRMEFDYVDPFNWWKTPGARLLHDADFTFERGYWTNSQAHAIQEAGGFTEPVEILEEDAIGLDQWEMKRQSLNDANMGQVTSQSSRNYPPHRFYEFQGRLLVKNSAMDAGKYEDIRVVLLDEKHVVTEEELKTWDNQPGYIEWCPTLDPCSDKPIGMIEPIEDIILEINDYENIALDNARKIVESPLLIDPQSTKQDKLYLGPAELNWVKNPRNSVVPLEMKDLPRSFYHQIGYLNDLVQRISGVSDYFGGMNTADTDRLSQTATGMSLMAQLSASRFGPMLASLDRDYYRKAARWIHETAKLWLTKPESIRIPSNPASPFVSVGPTDLDHAFAFNFNTKSLNPSSERRRAEFVKVAEMLSGSAPALMQQGYGVDFYELAKIMLDEFDRGAEAEHVIKPLAQLQVAPGMPGQPPGPPGLPVPPGVNPMEAMYPGPASAPVPGGLPPGPPQQEAA